MSALGDALFLAGMLLTVGVLLTLAREHRGGWRAYQRSLQPRRFPLTGRGVAALLGVLVLLGALAVVLLGCSAALDVPAPCAWTVGELHGVGGCVVERAEAPATLRLFVALDEAHAFELDAPYVRLDGVEPSQYRAAVEVRADGGWHVHVDDGQAPAPRFIAELRQSP